MKKIAVLGSTGSIGRQTLEVARANPELFTITALCAHHNSELLLDQICEFRPQFAGICLEERAKGLMGRLPPGTKLEAGEGAACSVAQTDADIIVIAVSGFAGLRPLIAALKLGKKVALANKESIVCGRGIIDGLISRYGGAILPVDSEQSAIFQCLNGSTRTEIQSLILTASGGPFRGYTLDQMRHITPEQAMNHPVWSMGRKISVDSATMFNKGLEIMEAGYLFHVPGDKIRVVIHPQSIVHSMVEFRDGAVMAQMSVPDMRLAIQYALTYPERKRGSVKRLSLYDMRELCFYAPDTEAFPAIKLAYEAMHVGEAMPIAYNGANEVAVQKFFEGESGFLDIPRCVEYAMGKMALSAGAISSVQDIMAADAQARRYAGEYYQSRK